MSLKNTSYFNPTSISNCALWLDAADTSTASMTLSGSNVSTWKDKSGTGNNASANTGTVTTNSTQINGLNTIRFNTNSYLNIPSFTMAANISAFAVLRGVVAQGSGNGGYFFLGNGAQPSFFVYTLQPQYGNISGPYSAWVASTGETNWYMPSNDFFLNNPGFIYTDNSTSYLNGSQLTFNPNRASVPNSVSAGTYSILVGGRGTDTLGFDFAECIFYNTTLTAARRQQIEGYLAWKWGLVSSLPASHPYALTPSYGVPSLVANAPAKTTLTYANHPVIAVGGCILWLDGNDPLGTGIQPADGSTISTWVNKSGSAYIMSTAGGTLTYSLSTKSIIFNGSSYYSSPITNQVYTIFFVFNITANSPLFARNLISTNDGFFPNYSGTTFLCQSDSQWYTQTSTFTASTTYIVSVQYDSLNNIYMWQNGALTPTISTTKTGTITANQLSIGYKANGGVYTNGNEYEIIMFNSTISTSQRQTIEGYLAQKWGLTAGLPAGHPYKSTFPLYLSPVTGVRLLANKRWSPLNPGNCQLWLDAADSSTFTFTTGNYISVWRDKSTYNNGGTVNTTPKPLLRITSPSKQPSLYFDGTCGIPLGSSFTSSLCSNFIIVFAPTPAAQLTNAQYAGNGYGGQMLLINGGAQGGEIQIQPDSMRSLIGSWKYSYFASRIESFSIAQFEFNYGTSLMNLWQNGTLAASTAFSNGTATAPTQLGISEYFATFGVAPYIGDVAEIIYYSVSLSTPQRQQAEGYLAWKWGLNGSLPSSHPYKLFPPSP